MAWEPMNSEAQLEKRLEDAFYQTEQEKKQAHAARMLFERRRGRVAIHMLMEMAFVADSNPTKWQAFITNASQLSPTFKDQQEQAFYQCLRGLLELEPHEIGNLSNTEQLKKVLDETLDKYLRLYDAATLDKPTGTAAQYVKLKQQISNPAFTPRQAIDAWEVNDLGSKKNKLISGADQWKPELLAWGEKKAKYLNRTPGTGNELNQSTYVPVLRIDREEKKKINFKVSSLPPADAAAPYVPLTAARIMRYMEDSNYSYGSAFGINPPVTAIQLLRRFGIDARVSSDGSEILYYKINTASNNKGAGPIKVGRIEGIRFEELEGSVADFVKSTWLKDKELLSKTGAFSGSITVEQLLRDINEQLMKNIGESMHANVASTLKRTTSETSTPLAKEIKEREQFLEEKAEAFLRGFYHQLDNPYAGELEFMVKGLDENQFVNQNKENLKKLQQDEIERILQLDSAGTPAAVDFINLEDVNLERILLIGKWVEGRKGRYTQDYVNKLRQMMTDAKRVAASVDTINFDQPIHALIGELEPLENEIKRLYTEANEDPGFKAAIASEAFDSSGIHFKTTIENAIASATKMLVGQKKPDAGEGMVWLPYIIARQIAENDIADGLKQLKRAELFKLVTYDDSTNKTILRPAFTDGSELVLIKNAFKSIPINEIATLIGNGDGSWRAQLRSIEVSTEKVANQSLNDRIMQLQGAMEDIQKIDDSAGQNFYQPTQQACDAFESKLNEELREINNRLQIVREYLLMVKPAAVEGDIGTHQQNLLSPIIWKAIVFEANDADLINSCLKKLSEEAFNRLFFPEADNNVRLNSLLQQEDVTLLKNIFEGTKILEHIEAVERLGNTYENIISQSRQNLSRDIENLNALTANDINGYYKRSKIPLEKLDSDAKKYALNHIESSVNKAKTAVDNKIENINGAIRELSEKLLSYAQLPKASRLKKVLLLQFGEDDLSNIQNQLVEHMKQKCTIGQIHQLYGQVFSQNMDRTDVEVDIKEAVLATETLLSQLFPDGDAAAIYQSHHELKQAVDKNAEKIESIDLFNYEQNLDLVNACLHVCEEASKTGFDDLAEEATKHINELGNNLKRKLYVFNEVLETNEESQSVKEMLSSDSIFVDRNSRDVTNFVKELEETKKELEAFVKSVTENLTDFGKRNPNFQSFATQVRHRVEAGLFKVKESIEAIEELSEQAKSAYQKSIANTKNAIAEIGNSSHASLSEQQIKDAIGKLNEVQSAGLVKAFEDLNAKTLTELISFDELQKLITQLRNIPGPNNSDCKGAVDLLINTWILQVASRVYSVSGNYNTLQRDKVYDILSKRTVDEIGLLVTDLNKIGGTNPEALIGASILSDAFSFLMPESDASSGSGKSIDAEALNEKRKWERHCKKNTKYPAGTPESKKQEVDAQISELILKNTPKETITTLSTDSVEEILDALSQEEANMLLTQLKKLLNNKTPYIPNYDQHMKMVAAINNKDAGKLFTSFWLWAISQTVSNCSQVNIPANKVYNHLETKLSNESDLAEINELIASINQYVGKYPFSLEGQPALIGAFPFLKPGYTPEEPTTGVAESTSMSYKEWIEKCKEKKYEHKNSRMEYDRAFLAIASTLQLSNDGKSENQEREKLGIFERNRYETFPLLKYLPAYASVITKDVNQPVNMLKFENALIQLEQYLNAEDRDQALFPAIFKEKVTGLNAPEGAEKQLLVDLKQSLGNMIRRINRNGFKNDSALSNNGPQLSLAAKCIKITKIIDKKMGANELADVPIPNNRFFQSAQTIQNSEQIDELVTVERNLKRAIEQLMTAGSAPHEEIEKAKLLEKYDRIASVDNAVVFKEEHPKINLNDAGKLSVILKVAPVFITDESNNDHFFKQIAGVPLSLEGEEQIKLGIQAIVSQYDAKQSNNPQDKLTHRIDAFEALIGLYEKLPNSKTKEVKSAFDKKLRELANLINSDAHFKVDTSSPSAQPLLNYKLYAQAHRFPAFRNEYSILDHLASPSPTQAAPLNSNTRVDIALLKSGNRINDVELTRIFADCYADEKVIQELEIALVDYVVNQIPGYTYLSDNQPFSEKLIANRNDKFYTALSKRLINTELNLNVELVPSDSYTQNQALALIKLRQTQKKKPIVGYGHFSKPKRQAKKAREETGGVRNFSFTFSEKVAAAQVKNLFEDPVKKEITERYFGDDPKSLVAFYDHLAQGHAQIGDADIVHHNLLVAMDDKYGLSETQCSGLFNFILKSSNETSGLGLSTATPSIECGQLFLDAVNKNQLLRVVNRHVFGTERPLRNILMQSFDFDTNERAKQQLIAEAINYTGDLKQILFGTYTPQNPKPAPETLFDAMLDVEKCRYERRNLTSLGATFTNISDLSKMSGNAVQFAYAKELKALWLLGVNMGILNDNGTLNGVDVSHPVIARMHNIVNEMRVRMNDEQKHQSAAGTTEQSDYGEEFIKSLNVFTDARATIPAEAISTFVKNVSHPTLASRLRPR